MADYRCPACGAYITGEGRFCSHCGTKIDDGVQRSEIKIDQHIQDDAEVRRSQYEEQESLLRQKEFASKLKAAKAKRIILLTILGIIILGTAVCVIIGYTTENKDLQELKRMLFPGIIWTFVVGGVILNQLIHGKW